MLYASIGADIPALHPYLPLMPRAGEIASRHRVALYACLYIALAERESCEVITADRGITSLQSQFSFIVPLSSFCWRPSHNEGGVLPLPRGGRLCPPPSAPPTPPPGR